MPHNMMQYYLSVFVAGFSLMVVEITSSRIVAPIIGSSIFTWTSVIGITLLGLSVGSLVGGEIADRYTKIYGQKVLSSAILLSSFFVYLIIPISKNMDSILNESFSTMTLSVIVCLLLFLLPSITMGALSPIIFKLFIGDIKNIGKKYGLLSSVWSLGSIAGVFMAGFYFISAIGSAGTIYLVSLVLLSLFYFFHIKSIKKNSPYFKQQIIFIISLSVFLLLSLYFIIQKKQLASPRTIFQKETAYYNVKVVDYDLYPQFGKNRILFLDIDAHSIQTEKPSKKFYSDMPPIFSAFSHKLQNIFVIGAGAYTLPINLRKYYPDSKISVSEIDPELEQVGRTYFDLDKYNIKTEIGDARIKFSSTANSSSEKYDLIFGDAYNSFISVPWHLLTKEFASKVKGHLNPDGIYAINFIGATEGPNSKIFESIYRTMKEVFPNNYIFSFGADSKEVQNITILGIKSDEYVSHDTLVEKLDRIDTTHFLSKLLVDKDSLNNNSGIKDGLILTDDFSPVDYMMIGLMDEYFPRYLSLYRKISS